jgi:hypothetical protein
LAERDLLLCASIVKIIMMKQAAIDYFISAWRRVGVATGIPEQ